MNAAAKRVKLAVAQAANSIRGKFQQLYDNRNETQRLLDEQYKPITNKFDSLIASSSNANGDNARLTRTPPSSSRRGNGRRPGGGDGGNGGGGNRRSVARQLFPVYNSGENNVEEGAVRDELAQVIDELENDRIGEAAGAVGNDNVNAVVAENVDLNAIANQIAAENQAQQNRSSNYMFDISPPHTLPMDTSDEEGDASSRSSSISMHDSMDFDENIANIRVNKRNRSFHNSFSSSPRSDNRKKRISSANTPQHASMRLSLNKKIAIRNQLAREQELDKARAILANVAEARATSASSRAENIDWDELKKESAQTKKARAVAKRRERIEKVERPPSDRKDRKRHSSTFVNPLEPEPDAPLNKKYSINAKIVASRPNRQRKQNQRQTLVDEYMKEVKRTTASKASERARRRSAQFNAVAHSGQGLFNTDVKECTNSADVTSPHIITYWNDANELVNRLRLLTASTAAGHTGHNNEIAAIVEELREAEIIE